ncbi:MAG: hypothetical protein ABSG68_23925 [Thermoguttaceae bacterium]|jgi:aspartate 1-decarboxylase
MAIYVDRKDNKGDLLTFMADGEEESQNYTLEGADKRTLKKGDVVAIQYTTDFERHRIAGLQKKVGK